MAAAFTAYGLDTQVAEDVFTSIWEKLAFNCAMNALAAISGFTVGQMGRSPAGHAVADRDRRHQRRRGARGGCAGHRRRHDGNAVRW
jgi:ketopantoate reductase